MLTFTRQELTHADITVRGAMTESQGLLWSSWYASMAQKHRDEQSHLPTDVAEALLWAVEATVDRLHDHLDNTGAMEDDISDTVDDLCLLTALENTLRAGLSCDLEDDRPALARTG
jgi:hypothetical protein